MATGLGIAPDASGSGLDPFTHRRIIQGRWSSTGVVSGFTVTRTSSLTVNVGGGVAVVSRGASDGMVEAYWPGGSVTLAAGPASGSRYDVVFVKQNDPTQGDADNKVMVGVVSGTAGSSPAVPAAPIGGLAVATLLVPQGMTASTGATVAADVRFAIPYGGSLGVLFDNTNTYDGTGGTTVGQWFTEQQGSFSLPTDRLIELRVMACISTQDQSDTAHGGWYLAFQVDGVDVVGTEFPLTRSWATFQYSWPMTLLAGKHTVALHSRYVWGSAPWFLYNPAAGSGASSSVGRRFQVWDRGVAQ